MTKYRPCILGSVFIAINLAYIYVAYISAIETKDKNDKKTYKMEYIDMLLGHRHIFDQQTMVNSLINKYSGKIDSIKAASMVKDWIQKNDYNQQAQPKHFIEDKTNNAMTLQR